MACSSWQGRGLAGRPRGTESRPVTFVHGWHKPCSGSRQAQCQKAHVHDETPCGLLHCGPTAQNHAQGSLETIGTSVDDDIYGEICKLPCTMRARWQSHRNLSHGHRGGPSHVRGSPADTTRLPSGSAMRHGSLSWFGILDLAGRGGHGCLTRPRPSRSRCNHMVFLPSAAVALRRCLYEVPACASRHQSPESTGSESSP